MRSRHRLIQVSFRTSGSSYRSLTYNVKPAPHPLRIPATSAPRAWTTPYPFRLNAPAGGLRNARRRVFQPDATRFNSNHHSSPPTMSRRNIVDVPELLGDILERFRAENPSKEFVALRLVSRKFDGMVWRMLWRRSADGGFRPLLSHVGDYDVAPRDIVRSFPGHILHGLTSMQGHVTIRNGLDAPDPAKWIRLQNRIACHLHTLVLDFFTILPLNIVGRILASFPDALHFPRLQKLRVKMDMSDSQLALVKRFIQTSVQDFSIEAFLPSDDVAYIGDRPRAELDYLDSLEEEVAEARWKARRKHLRAVPATFVKQLCTDVLAAMPGLKQLRVVVSHPKMCYEHRHDIAAAILSLPRLISLDLAQHMAVPTFLQELEAHPSLQTITTYRSSWPLRAIKLEWRDGWMAYRTWTWGPDGNHDDMDPQWLEDVVPPANVPTLGIKSFNGLTTLQITASVFEMTANLRKWHPSAMRHLTELKLDTGMACTPTVQDVTTLFELLASRFQELTVLSVGSIANKSLSSARWGSPTLSIDADTLRPLTTLAKLVSLTVVAKHPSNIPTNQWPSLLKYWPRLEIMVLDNLAYRDVNRPLPPGTATIDGVLAIFAAHCPRLRILSVHVDGTVSNERGDIPPHLAALEIVVPAALQEDRRHAIVTYLGAVLPPHCGLNIIAQGADYAGVWTGLQCSTWPVEGENAVIKLWRAEQAAKGRPCVTKVCEETGGEMLVSEPADSEPGATKA